MGFSEFSTTIKTLASRRGGLKTRPVTIHDLDTLRWHRNDNDVRQWLEYDKQIDEQQQQAWFDKGGASAFRIVSLGTTDVGLSRVASDGLVGCDAFKEYRSAGGGAMALAAAIDYAAKLEAKDIYLWTFINNVRGVPLYLSAGFEWDTCAEVKWILRDFNNTGKPVPEPYGRMNLNIRS